MRIWGYVCRRAARRRVGCHIVHNLGRLLKRIDYVRLKGRTAHDVWSPAARKAAAVRRWREWRSAINGSRGDRPAKVTGNGGASVAAGRDIEGRGVII